MKRQKLSFLLILLMSMMSLTVTAHDIAVENSDGVTIYYNWINNNTELSVTSGDGYSGNVVIPPMVSYRGATYSVTEIGEGAFSDCTTLASISMPYSLKSIGDWAFNCSSISSVSIPEGITILRRRVFNSCQNLTSIVFPSSLKTIDEYAFAGCSSLSTINLPDNLEALGKECFSYCPSIKNVRIPASVNNIGEGVFLNSNDLETVTVQNANPADIASNTFANCNNTTLYVPKGCRNSYLNEYFWKDFKEIIETDYEYTGTIYSDGDIRPNGTFTWIVSGVRMKFRIVDEEAKTVEVGNGLVASIDNSIVGEITIPSQIALSNGTYTVVGLGENAFRDCTVLTNVQMPNGLLYIGRYAFWHCEELTSINIPEGTQRLDYDCFAHCKNVPSVYIPNSVTSITWDHNVFEGCTNLSTITVAEDNPVFDSRNGCNAIIETVENKLRIGCKGTIIPDDIVIIGHSSFSNMGDLSGLTIPASVTNIISYAFWGCSFSSITSYIQTPFETSCVFDHLTEGATLYVPKGTKEAYQSKTEWNNFQNIVEMDKSGIVPSDENIQPDGTFTWTIPSDVKMTFKVIDAVNKYVQVGNGETPCIDVEIAGELFIPATVNGYTVTTIGAKAFRTCRKLTAISLPATIKTILDGAFYCCDNILSMSIPEGVTALNFETFTYCSSLREVTIPESVTSIGGSVFYSCESLTEISLPQNLTSIGSFAFTGCPLKSIILPTSLTSIGQEAFRDCFNLETITSYIENIFSINNICLVGTVTPMERYQVVMLRVPNGTKGLYQQTEGWSDFQNISEMVEEEEMTLEYTDPTSNVVYVYTTTGTTAKVKAGNMSNWTSGSPNASGDIVILDKITVNGRQYTVTEIGDFALYGRNIRSITIPATIEQIGQYACYGWSLRNISVLGTQPALLSSLSFSRDTYFCATLSFPDGAEDNYFNANGWKEFFSYVKKDGIVYHISSWDEHKAEVMGLYGEVNGILDISSSIEHRGESYNVTTVWRNAFHGNSSIISVTIPSTMTDDFSYEGSFPDSPFSSCNNLTTIVVAADNPKFDSRNNCNAIIEKITNTLVVGSNTTVIPNDVVAIARDAFYGATFTEITIPASVQSIGQIAFGNCNNLNAFKVLSETPFSLNSGVFSESSHNVFQYATLYVPKGCKAAYEKANVWKNFTNIVEMEEDIDPDAVINFADAEVKRICVENWDSNGDGELSYGEAAAVNDLNEKFTANRTIVTFDELQYFTGLTSMGYDFGHCYELQSVIVPKNVTSMGAHTFKWCTKLSHLELPEELVDVKDFALHGCESLPEIVIPKNVRYIRDWAFQCCNSINSMEIPENVELVGTSIVSACPLLTTLTVNDANPYYDSRDNCNAIIHTASNTMVASCQTTTIPSSVKAIGDYAFCFCEGLTAIEIPFGIESIGVSAFNGNEFKSIDIPASVSSIGDKAFFNCNDLTSVTVRMGLPIVITENTFSNRANATLYVPIGSKAAYEAADYWKDFKEIIEVKPDNFLSAEEATMKLGGKKTIALQLDNVTPLIAAEFRLQLPAGLTIDKDENNNFVAAIVSDRRVNHTLTMTDEGNGLYHFLSYSNPIRAYKGNSGDFITLSIVSDGSMEEGTYTATLKNIIFSDENEQKLTFVDSSFDISVIDYTTGDANGDGSLDVMDVVKMVSHIMGRNPSNFKFVAADIDGNGKVNVMDLVNLINLIMSTPQQTSAIAPHVQSGSMELSKTDDEAIAVSIPFADRHVAAQFVISVADGAVLQEVVADEAHQSKFTRMSDGRYKVMVFSGCNATFSSNSPIKLQLSGNGDVKIEDAMFVDTDEEAVAFESAALNTTGISAVGTTFAQPVDIYTVGGKLLKSGATSTQGLAKGVYVVNNQKLIVK